MGLRVDKTTKRALSASVAKWKKIAAGEMESNGPDNCPLCKLFYADRCSGCPVANFTGFNECINTPYEVFQDLADEDQDGGFWARSDSAIIAANAEYNFLRALNAACQVEDA